MNDPLESPVCTLTWLIEQGFITVDDNLENEDIRVILTEEGLAIWRVIGGLVTMKDMKDLHVSKLSAGHNHRDHRIMTISREQWLLVQAKLAD